MWVLLVLPKFAVMKTKKIFSVTIKTSAKCVPSDCINCSNWMFCINVLSVLKRTFWYNCSLLFQTSANRIGLLPSPPIVAGGSQIEGAGQGELVEGLRLTWRTSQLMTSCTSVWSSSQVVCESVDNLCDPPFQNGRRFLLSDAYDGLGANKWHYLSLVGTFDVMWHQTAF